MMKLHRDWDQTSIYSLQLLHKSCPLHLPYFYTSAIWNSPKTLQSPELHLYPTLQSPAHHPPKHKHMSPTPTACWWENTASACKIPSSFGKICCTGAILFVGVVAGRSCCSFCVDFQGAALKADGYVVFSSLKRAAVAQRETQDFKNDLHPQEQAIRLGLHKSFNCMFSQWRYALTV